MKVADKAWVAAALLHKQNPNREDFDLHEIADRAKQEFGGEGSLQPGVWQHMVSHGVAQNKPSPVKLRFFTKTERGRRRLFRFGDPSNRNRNGRTHPDPNNLPEQYRGLVDWYLSEYSGNGNRGPSSTALASSSPRAFLAFVGLIPAYDLGIMQKTIEQDCERIDNE
jgi:hypothetical protein